MDGAVTPAAIAISISIATSLPAGFLGVLVAMRSREGAAVSRDRAVSILLGVAFLLILFNVIGASVIAIGGMAYVGLIKAARVLTAAFAVVGMVLGLVRGLRNGRAIKTQRV